MIQIIPAIDLIGGKCVRLSQGDYAQKKTYGSDPADMAMRYADCGVTRIHVVDLDGAKASCPQNLRTLEKIASTGAVSVEWGGGIKSAEALGSIFDAGACWAIIGSVAALKPELFREWLLAFGAGRMVLGSDVKDGMVAVNGWTERTTLSIKDQVELFRPEGLSQVICTDISRDGMLEGPSFDLYTGLQKEYDDIDFTVSGGVSCMDDIRKAEELGLRKIIVGKAIYENRISLKEIEQWLLKG